MSSARVVCVTYSCIMGHVANLATRPELAPCASPLSHHSAKGAPHCSALQLGDARTLPLCPLRQQRRATTSATTSSAKAPATIATMMPMERPPEEELDSAAAGVDKVNHNLNTSERFYSEVCSTHTYADRVATLEACRSAGLQLCSGGIMGMGETHEDLIDMALELRAMNVESIPLNFLNSIDGTPLEGTNRISPRDCLRALAMMRMVNPAAELRIAGGREIHLGSLQPLGLYAANSLFVGDYLTTKGQLPEADYRMIEEMGFVITRGSEAAEPPALPG